MGTGDKRQLVFSGNRVVSQMLEIPLKSWTKRGSSTAREGFDVEMPSPAVKHALLNWDSLEAGTEKLQAVKRDPHLNYHPANTPFV